METDIYYYIFFICSIYFIPLAGLSESDFEAINYTPGRDGYYDDETPANWVDTLFGIFIIYHHLRYAYKFTDYSLIHIHPAAASEEEYKENKEKAELQLTQKSKEAEEENEEKDSNSDDDEYKDEEQVQKIKLNDNKLHSHLVQKLQTNYSTQSTNKTIKRPMHNTICCCIPFAPRFFTWERTYLIRTFLKLFLSLSCLLSVVLYLEFAMNFFVEFIITCIVHYKEGYPAALLVLPAIVFMFDTFIRLSWHAVVVSWQFNGDANGDLEVLREMGDKFLLNANAQKSLHNLIGAGSHTYLDKGDDEELVAQSSVEVYDDAANVGDFKARISSGLRVWRNNIVVNIGGMSTEDEEKVIKYYTRILHTLKTVDMSQFISDDGGSDDDGYGDGGVDRSETEVSLSHLKKFFKREGIDIPLYIIKNVFCAIDTDKNGSISAKEFMIFRDAVDLSKVEYLATSTEYIGMKKGWVKKRKRRVRKKKKKKNEHGMQLIEEEDIGIRSNIEMGVSVLSTSTTTIVTKTTVTTEDKTNETTTVITEEKIGDMSPESDLDPIVELPVVNSDRDTVILKMDTFPLVSESAPDVFVDGGTNADSGFVEVKDGGSKGGDVDSTSLHNLDGGSGSSYTMETDSSSSSEEETPEEKKLRKAAQKAKRKKKALHRRKMGDFFLATCWRFGFFVNTLLFTLIASATINVEIAVNGLFFQLWMRYCVFAGCIWTFVYILFSIYLQVYARLKTWKLVHESIPRWKFWFLVDAQDFEAGHNKRWMYVKMTVMVTLLLTGIILIFLRSFVGNNGGFMYFVGIILLFYYILTVYLSCKPYALVALWTDNIPPPSESFFSHAELINQIYGEDTPFMANLHSRGRTLSVGHAQKNQSMNQLEKDSSVGSAGREKPTRKATALEDAMRPLSHLATATEKQEHKDRIQILTRYEEFNYRCQDINVNEEQYKWFGRRHYFRTKNSAFHANYVAYWLNIYRPFDEYDIEANFGNNRILFGFQWLKPLVDCKCTRKRSKKSKAWTICKYIMDNMCNLCVVVFLAVLLYMLFYLAQRLSNNNSAILSEENSNYTTGYYSICTDIWLDEEAAGDNYYTVMDMLYLVQIVYEIDNANATELVQGYFGTDLEIIKTTNTVPVFMHLRDTRNSTSSLDFITIRGTASMLEILQDISLFVEIGILEGLQWLIPFLNGLPDTLLRQIVYYASQPEGYINADSRAQFDDDVFAYGQELLQNSNKSATLHFMGHSLGGGIAEIVAANLYEWILENTAYIQNHIHSFGVCSPGVLYSSAKFGFGITALDKTSSSLLPRRDVVSAVDSHGGSIQYVECSEDALYKCHFTDVVICEVYNNCPSTLLTAAKKKIFDCYCADTNTTRGFRFCVDNVTLFD